MMNPTEILRMVDDAAATFDATLSEEGRQAREARRHDDVTSSLVYAAHQRDEAMRDFELLAVADSLQALGEAIQAECDRRMAEAYRMALRAFYVAEELAQDPAHAELIPHVAAIRAAHEKQYGRPIPPRPAEWPD